MRLLIALIGFQFLATSLYGQIDVELYFRNDCDNSIIKLDFELLNIDSTFRALIQSKNGIAVVPTKGTYQVTSNYTWGDNLIGSFDDVIEVNTAVRQVDTIYIPKIKSTWDGVLHPATYWYYFKCDKLCEGLEIDYYPNGQKRLEGEFIKGKPNHIIEYQKEGKKKFECWYIPGTSSQTRVNWYDSNGELDEYDKYDKRKHRTIKTTYTAQGKKVTREVIKHGK